MIRALASNNFHPFGQLRLNFAPVQDRPADVAEVHLLTGVNGTGKTRILSVLAAMMGNDLWLKKRLKGTQGSNFAVSDSLGAFDGAGNLPSLFHAFSGGTSWSGAQIAAWLQNVPAFAYNGMAYLTDAGISVLAGVPKPDRATCLSFNRPENHSQKLLQAIANLKVQAAMDNMNTDNPGAISRPTEIIRALESALSGITGQRFMFNVTNYPQPVLAVKWGNTELPFDLLPDGLRSIIGWMVDAVVMLDAWLQGKGKIAETEAVFLLDEMESHLHPVWQRRILPAFQRLFPKAQIFIATHSPFVIASLNHGWIYRLFLENNGNVAVAKPQKASAGDSYISVIEDIMGLHEWYDPETEKLLSDFRSQRDMAYKGDSTAKASAFEMAKKLGERSMELQYMMGKEISQMERQLAGAGKK